MARELYKEIQSSIIHRFYGFGRKNSTTKTSCLIFFKEVIRVNVNEMNGNDTSLETIKKLFYEQIKVMTLKVKADSFDLQFSDGWLR